MPSWLASLGFSDHILLKNVILNCFTRLFVSYLALLCHLYFLYSCLALWCHLKLIQKVLSSPLWLYHANLNCFANFSWYTLGLLCHLELLNQVYLLHFGLTPWIDSLCCLFLPSWMASLCFSAQLCLHYAIFTCLTKV